jgi:hypothetical protein
MHCERHYHGGSKRMSKRKSTSRTKQEAEVRNRALHVLARMRRTGISLTVASREEGIDPRTVRHYVGADLKELSGQTVPTKADQRERRMLVLTSRGMIPDTIRGSEKASENSRYLAAVGQFFRHGTTEALKEFEGKKIGGFAYITDTKMLTSLAEAGIRNLETIYASPETSA